MTPQPIHRTDPDAAELHASGWARLLDGPLPGGGVEVTRLPLIDSQHRLEDGTPLLARLTYRDALRVAERLGAALPTRDEVRRLHVVGLQLEPITMAITATLAGSKKHDAELWRRLRALGWDGGRPVSGAGKHWIAGAPPGRAYLAGWWTRRLESYSPTRRGPGWVQEGATSGPGPHDDGHHDYGTTTILVRRVCR